MLEKMMVFARGGAKQLGGRIAERLGLSLGEMAVGTFSDGECDVRVDTNVRGKDVFVVQSTCAPVNQNLMELLVVLDAMRWASAARITAVVPYFGYARQDRRVRSARVPITARLVAKMIADAGADRVLTVDLHSEQIQGFFDIPVDNIFAQPVLIQDILSRGVTDPLIVSPDVGGVVRARALAKCLHGADLAIIDKRRPRKNAAEAMHIIGEVYQRDCIIVDDMIDTAGTLCTAATALKKAGARTVMAYCTHPVFSGKATASIGVSALDAVVVTDTIPLKDEASTRGLIHQVSVDALLAETMRRIATDGSVTDLFR